MKCRNCCAELKEMSEFCPKCGFPLDEEGIVIDDNTTPSNEGKASKKTKLMMIFSGIVALFVVVAAIGVLAGPAVKNTLNSMFSEPYEYLFDVQNENVKEFAERLADVTCVFAGGIDAEKGVSVEISASFEDEFKKLIAEKPGSEFAKVSDWVNSAGFLFGVRKEDNNIVGSADVGLNVNNIASVGYIADFDEEEVYVSAPVLSKKSLRIRFDELGISPEEISKLEEAVGEVTDVIPDKKVIAGMICRYMDAAASQIKDVTKSKETLSAEGISKRNTLLTASIDSEVAKKISGALLEEMENDKEFDALMSDLSEITCHDSGYFKAKAEAALKALAESGLSDKNPATLKVWVDSEGRIDGMGMTLPGYGEFSYTELTDGKKIASRLFVKFAENELEVTGKVTLSAGKLNGEYKALLNNAGVIEFKVENFDVAGFKEGKINGRVIAEPLPDFAKLLELTGSLTGEYDKLIPDMRIETKLSSASVANVKADIDVYCKDKKFVTFMVDAVNSSDVVVEKTDSAVDYSNIGSWIQESDIKYLKRAFDDAGAPEGFAEKVKAALLERWSASDAG